MNKFDFQLYNTYLEILAAVGQCGGEKGMIAGGAVRDMLLDKPIRDIDVFYEGKLDLKKIKEHFTFKPKVTVNPAKEIQAKWLNKLEQDLFGDEPEQENPYDDDGSGTWTVTHGEVWYKECIYPIQLIKVDDITTHMDTFGVGISKVAILADGVLWTTKDYIEDVSTQTLHFDPNCGEKYTSKICAKFPEYEAVEKCLMY